MMTQGGYRAFTMGAIGDPIRWVTVTGRHWRGGGLPESTAALSSLLAEWQRGG